MKTFLLTLLVCAQSMGAEIDATLKRMMWMVISGFVGALSASASNGSLYLRMDGTGSNLYVRENGAWVAK